MKEYSFSKKYDSAPVFCMLIGGAISMLLLVYVEAKVVWATSMAITFLIVLWLALKRHQEASKDKARRKEALNFSFTVPGYVSSYYEGRSMILITVSATINNEKITFREKFIYGDDVHFPWIRKISQGDDVFIRYDPGDLSVFAVETEKKGRC